MAAVKGARILAAAAGELTMGLEATTSLGAGGAQPRWQTSGGVGTSQGATSQVLFPSNSDNLPTTSDDEMTQIDYERDLDNRAPTLNQRHLEERTEADTERGSSQD